MKSICLTCALFVVSVVATARAAEPEILTKSIAYKDGETQLEGYVAMPAGTDKKLPGILVIHDWTGLQDYARQRADQLAALGYVAFCADIYGKGIRPTDPADCGKEAMKYKGDRALFRSRLAAALEQLKAQPNVDGAKTAAIGYCFGGTAALEVARSGADVLGVVSFHGGLDSPTPEDAKNIKGKVLVLHGADDPYVKETEIKAFAEEMRTAKVDWQMIAYGGAVHSFSKKEAGDDNSKGAAYNAKADARSWEDMKQFFAEIFGAAKVD